MPHPTKNQVKTGISKTFGAIDSAANAIDKMTKNNPSIAGLAKENIFEFPVFISDSVELDYATAVNSLMEQVYASYLQAAISINPVVDAETVKNNKQFSAFKTNTNKYLECTDMSYAHDACHNIIQEGATTLEFSMLTIGDKDIDFVNEYCNHDILSEFEHYFQEATIDTDSDEYKDAIQRAKDEAINNDTSVIKTEKDNSLQKLNIQREELAKKQLNDYDADHDRSVAGDNLSQDIANEKLTQAMKDTDNYDARENRNKTRHNYDTKTNAPKILDEGKINKLNTMKPLMMNVELKVASDNGNISAPIEYVVGVKTFIRRIDNDILPEVAQYPMKEMNKLSRRAKWKAGEIKFLEYIFKTKEKKQTAIDSKDPKRKWYRRLYELAHSQNDSISTVLKTSSKKDIFNIKSKLKTTGSVMPNATIVISKADVDNIKDKTGIDMLKGSTAKSFCKELFLMGLVVVDVDSSSIKMLIPDLHNDYEVHSIASVNKQIGMLDTLGVKTSDLKRLLG